MKLTVDEIAALVGGRVIGKGGAVINGVAGLAEATASDISFLRDIKNANAMKSLETTAAGAVIVPEGVPTNGKTFVHVKNPMAAFATVLNKVAEEKRSDRTAGTHPSAVVASSAKIGKNVSIGPLCVIEDGAVIGDDVTLVAQVYVGKKSQVGNESYLYANVVLREEVTVGKRCLIHPGTVLGSDGFGFFYSDGVHNKIPQIGTVVIEDDVEIGACCAIDRATTGQTIIHKGTKLDNLVHVAHNVEVGAYSLLAAQSGIAGSSKLGKGVVLAGQVGVADHVTVGDGVQVGAQSGVKDDVPAGAILFGSPAQPLQDTLRQILLMRKLPELFKDVRSLLQKIGKS